MPASSRRHTETGSRAAADRSIRRGRDRWAPDRQPGGESRCVAAEAAVDELMIRPRGLPGHASSRDRRARRDRLGPRQAFAQRPVAPVGYAKTKSEEGCACLGGRKPGPSAVATAAGGHAGASRVGGHQAGRPASAPRALLTAPLSGTRSDAPEPGGPSFRLLHVAGGGLARAASTTRESRRDGAGSGGFFRPYGARGAVGGPPCQRPASPVTRSLTTRPISAPAVKSNSLMAMKPPTSWPGANAM